jgi:hypothetical protein
MSFNVSAAQSKIRELDVSVHVYEDVLGFKIAVANIVPMQVLDSQDHLSDQHPCLSLLKLA